MELLLAVRCDELRVSRPSRSTSFGTMAVDVIALPVIFLAAEIDLVNRIQLHVKNRTPRSLPESFGHLRAWAVQRLIQEAKYLRTP